MVSYGSTLKSYNKFELLKVKTANCVPPCASVGLLVGTFDGALVGVQVGRTLGLIVGLMVGGVDLGGEVGIKL